MSRFEIAEIGEEVAPEEGIPDGCDLCGHCAVLRHVFGAQMARSCAGGRKPEGTASPFENTTPKRPQEPLSAD